MARSIRAILNIATDKPQHGYKESIMPQPKASTTNKTHKVSEEQKLTRLVEGIIDKGANTAEEINRAILDLPVTMLEGLGLEETADDVKKVQDSSIGAIYKLIHDINHKVANLATDLLEQPGEKRR
jgi:uncharacterized protein YaaR (DUF327 family)